MKFDIIVINPCIDNSPIIGLLTEGKTLDIARPTVIQKRKKKAVEKVRIPVYDRKYKGANVQVRPTCLI